MPKSKHPWDLAAAKRLTRVNPLFGGKEEAIDPGVNFFVLALEALGARTRFSCEGHPTSFYVVFEAPYSLALQVKSAGFFTVEVEGHNVWSIRKTLTEVLTLDGAPYTERSKRQTLRWAAEAWLRTFGDRLAGLDFLPSPADSPQASN